MNYSCGCQFVADEQTGAMRRINRCFEHHRAAMVPHGPELILSAMQTDGRLAETERLKELIEVIGPFPKPGSVPRCLEIGCGASPYVGALRLAGWQYVGLDIASWAAHWNAVYWGAHSVHADWESWVNKWQFGLILCVNVLEYMRDAPVAIKLMRERLDRDGHIIIATDDSNDIDDPDINWRFSSATLLSAIECAGLRVANSGWKAINSEKAKMYVIAKLP